MFIVSAIYGNSPGSRFDEKYYLFRHRPMVEELLQPFGLKGLRILKGAASLNEQDLPFRIIAEMHFETREGFEQGMAQHGETVLGDAPNYTDIEPILQVSEVLAE